jgi:hypothetical protein
LTIWHACCLDSSCNESGKKLLAYSSPAVA